MNRHFLRSLLAAAIWLLTVLVGCSQHDASPPRPLDAALQIPTQAPRANSAVPTPTPKLLLVPTPTPEIRGSTPDIAWSVSPSLNEQIFDSDKIVRASLASATAGTESVPSEPGVAPTYRAVSELRFTVHEYLKGSGASEVVIVVRDEDTHVSQEDALSRAQDRLKQRQTTWDDREAVLFLRAGESFDGPFQTLAPQGEEIP